MDTWGCSRAPGGSHCPGTPAATWTGRRDRSSGGLCPWPRPRLGSCFMSGVACAAPARLPLTEAGVAPPAAACPPLSVRGDTPHPQRDQPATWWPLGYVEPFPCWKAQGSIPMAWHVSQAEFAFPAQGISSGTTARSSEHPSPSHRVWNRTASDRVPHTTPPGPAAWRREGVGPGDVARAPASR